MNVSGVVLAAGGSVRLGPGVADQLLPHVQTRRAEVTEAPVPTDVDTREGHERLPAGDRLVR